MVDISMYSGVQRSIGERTQASCLCLLVPFDRFSTIFMSNYATGRFAQLLRLLLFAIFFFSAFYRAS